MNQVQQPLSHASRLARAVSRARAASRYTHAPLPHTPCPTRGRTRARCHGPRASASEFNGFACVMAFGVTTQFLHSRSTLSPPSLRSFSAAHGASLNLRSLCGVGPGYMTTNQGTSCDPCDVSKGNGHSRWHASKESSVPTSPHTHHPNHLAWSVCYLDHLCRLSGGHL